MQPISSFSRVRKLTTLQGLRNLCWQCRQQHIAAHTVRTQVIPASFSQTYPNRWSHHAFTTSTALHKKGGKGFQQNDAAPLVGEASPNDPRDLSELDAEITKVLEKLRDNLSKLRGGGKFNPDILEELRVKLDKSTGSSQRLGDLAQVIPRGRILNIIAGERDHIKAITSAIQGSDLSLTPQPDPQDPLQLNITIPPPTTESRQQAVQAAIKLGETANHGLKTARQTQQKKFRAMQLDKKNPARPDDLRKAGEKMEKVVQAGTAEVKKIVDSAKKVLESG